MSDQGQIDKTGTAPETSEIARWVLGISGATILLVSSLVLIGAWRDPKEFGENTRTVFNALLPLLGTWVGTVLAYYFSRKNFESASQSVERMVTLTTEQKLAQLFVEKEMLHPSQIVAYQIPSGKTTIIRTYR
jgi:hypothetical protein